MKAVAVPLVASLRSRVVLTVVIVVDKSQSIDISRNLMRVSKDKTLEKKTFENLEIWRAKWATLDYFGCVISMGHKETEPRQNILHRKVFVVTQPS